MYGFPTDKEKRKKWLAQLSRSNLTVNKKYNNNKICEVKTFKTPVFALFPQTKTTSLGSLD